MVRALKGLGKHRPATVGSLGRCFAFAGLVLLVSCADAFAPGDLAGTYALRTLRGDSLPTPLRLDGTSPLLLADTIVIGSDGRGVWIDVYEYEPTGGATVPDTARFIMNVEVIERGGQKLLAERYVCSPLAIVCRAPEEYHIARWNGELVLGDGPRYYTKQPD